MFIIRRALTWSCLAAFCVWAAAGQTAGSITTGGSTERPIPVTGQAVIDDGSPLPRNARIELVCPPHTQVQGETNSKGGFSFDLGQNRVMAANDAGMSSPGANAGFGGQLQALGRPVTQLDGMSVTALVGCFLRAALPGYTSDSYDMSRIRVGDGTTNVGTLYLHPLSRTSETVVSATSLSAPKDAQKFFRTGWGYVEKGQFAQAEAELRRAVTIYPKYADAWQELGGVLQFEKKHDEARTAFVQAKASDPAFSRPYLSLALLSAQESKWQDALDNAAALIQLDAKAYPQAYYYRAVAYYNLSNPDKAFENARQAVELDTRHTIPLAEKLLGLIYSDRGDYKAAAEQYRNCIEHMGDAPGVDPVRKLHAQAEEQAARAARK